MKSVIVIGAGGFIGAHLTRRYADDGQHVIAVTRQSIRTFSPCVTNVVGNFDTAEAYAPLLKDCRLIIHAASSTTPGSTAARPQFEGNLRPTLALLEALQFRPEIRLIYLSSAGTVYDETLTRMVIESDPPAPRSYHGAGKAAAEMFTGAWTRQYGATALLLRASNGYGPGQSFKRGFGIIPTAFDRCLRAAPISIWATAKRFVTISMSRTCSTCVGEPMHPTLRRVAIFSMPPSALGPQSMTSWWRSKK